MDNPKANDNRAYEYSAGQSYERAEHLLILNQIPAGASVIDLGCGDGTLLAMLREKGCKVEGIEVSESGVQLALQKGLRVKQGRVDEGLKEYQAQSFDYSICNVTIQMVMYPERLLEGMRRISKQQIVSFPNFGHYANRFDLLFNGRFPKPTLFGYKWFSTGHVHQLSFSDFEDFCRETKWTILKFLPVSPSKKLIQSQLQATWKNLFLLSGVYILKS